MRIPPDAPGNADCLWMDERTSYSIPQEGKRIMFLKSEIDKWLIGEQLKSIREIEADAEAFCVGRKERKL